MPASRCEQAQHQLFYDPSQIVRGICVFPVLFSAYTDTRAQTHVHAHTRARSHTALFLWVSCVLMKRMC